MKTHPKKRKRKRRKMIKKINFQSVRIQNKRKKSIFEMKKIMILKKTREWARFILPEKRFCLTKTWREKCVKRESCAD